MGDEACDRVIEATIRAGKIAAIAHPPYDAIDTMSHYYTLGARMMRTSLVPFIKNGMAKWDENIKGIAAENR